MTPAELEHIAKIILKHTTQKEGQEFLKLDETGKQLWLQNKLENLEVKHDSKQKF